ncbi:MAG TPA: type IV secretion system DNA-binding domain-containing protein [Candidatus Binataceae bacterium]|nr:type IV secretion system DNA-binding domain-containing protein [Candidatus Binataceae bacterium]
MDFSASDAARWQAYQTRARIGARIWFTAIKGAVFVWFVLTIYVVWHETLIYFPDFGQRYFLSWLLAWLFTDVPGLRDVGPRLHLQYQGRWYPLPSMYQFLNGPHFYKASFGFWFAHFCRYTAIVPLAFFGIFVALKLRRESGPEHVRGLKLLTAGRLNAQLTGGAIHQLSSSLTRFASRTQRTAPLLLQIGAVMIPAKKEPENFLVTGSPGAGKSTLIRHFLRRIAERGQSAIILDPEREYVQEFYDRKRGDLILNPRDRRCPWWSPWNEFRKESFETDVAALAASMLPDLPNTFAENASARFFRESSRTLLEAIFHKVPEHQTEQILQLLALPREELRQTLVGTPAEPLIDPGAHEQGAGIIATATGAVRPFQYLPRHEDTDASWSAQAWAGQPRGWLFLTSMEDSRAALIRLQALWLDSLVRWLLGADLEHAGRQVWIVIDELAVLGYQPQLEQLVTRGRKRGLCVVMGFQNVSQLRSIYGRDRTTTLTSAPTTKVILRCDEAETAEWASEQLGKHEILRLEMTSLAGLSSYREGFNLQPHRSVEPIVMAAEVQSLREYEGYLCVAGADRAKITIPPGHLERHQPPFLARQPLPGEASGLCKPLRQEHEKDDSTTEGRPVEPYGSASRSSRDKWV